MRVRLLLVLIGLLTLTALTPSGANAAGVGQYSPPDWWPLRGSNLVGCTYNSPGSICGGNYHPVWAIDVQAAEGQPVYASGSGLAKVSSNTTACTGYGRSVVVEHGGATKSLYAHLSNFSAALNASPGGVWVDANTVIGYVGHTGAVSNCSYNHLHYEETTNGGFWSSATDPGPLHACIGSSDVTYPQQWGRSTWAGLPGHTYTARHDGAGCGGTSDGSFVSVSGHAEVYRVAGGAPIYVSNWASMGGPQPVQVIGQAQFDAMRPVPADGTFVSSTSTGRVYEIAGGAPEYVSAADASKVPGWGSRPIIGIDQWALDNLAHPLAHMRPVPADGTLISNVADGRVYVVAGGAPEYISAADASKIPGWGSRPITALSFYEFSQYEHLRRYPADGTLISNVADGRVYVVAGGAPIYITAANASKIPGWGSRPITVLSYYELDQYEHLRKRPTDGTFLNTTSGRAYRVAGGAPLYITTWNIYGGQQPFVTIDQWAVDTASDPTAHLSGAPADGTVVQGLPSGAFWSFTGGQRTPASANPAAIGIDDATIAQLPLKPCPVGQTGTPPNCTAPTPPRTPDNVRPNTGVGGERESSACQAAKKSVVRARDRMLAARVRARRSHYRGRAQRTYRARIKSYRSALAKKHRNC